MQMQMNKDNIIIYTDGACWGNPGQGGWGAVIIKDNETKEINGYDEYTTNNKMELTAVIKSLQLFEKKQNIEIYTDSKYVKDGITKWIKSWKFNNWKTSSKKPVKNKELWEKLDKQNEKHKIDWNWVKGHSTNKLNNRADELATNAIRNKSRILDEEEKGTHKVSTLGGMQNISIINEKELRRKARKEGLEKLLNDLIKLSENLGIKSIEDLRKIIKEYDILISLKEYDLKIKEQYE